MADTPARGALGKLGMGSATATATVDQCFEYNRCTLKKRSIHSTNPGIRGTRGRLKQRTREVRREVAGQIESNPTTTELDRLWQWMIGGTTGGSSPHSPGETLTTRLITVDKISKVYSYAGCVASKFTLSGQSGGVLGLSIDVEGTTETEANAGTFPSISAPLDNFFVCSDVTFNFNSTAYTFGQFSFTVDNLCDTDRYLNSLTRTQIAAMDRMVTLQLGMPFDTDHNGLYGQAVAGAAGSLVITDGTTTYTIALTNVKIPPEGPEVNGKTEIMLPINCNIFGDGTDPEFVITKS